MYANKSINSMQHQSSAKAHDFSDCFTNGVTTALFSGISQLVAQARFIAKAGRLDLKHFKSFGRKNTAPHDAVTAILIIGVDIPCPTKPLDGCNKKHCIRGSPFALNIFIILHWLFYKILGQQINGYRKATVKMRQYLPTQFIKFFNIVRLRHEATHHE